MHISQKCQYTVRAILELSKRYPAGSVPARDVAASQDIPQRFLEIILNELKPSGLVESRRGPRGGYSLSRPPKAITVGQVIRLVEGPLDLVRCTSQENRNSCALQGQCSLTELWNQAKQAVERVYDSTTFQDLIDREDALQQRKRPDYCI